MTSPIRILMQTTIPFAEDDWHIGRFSLLRDELASLKDESGKSLYEVTTRDRETDAAGNDPVLSTLDKSDFQELWLFAIDQGDGLTVTDCQGITRFRQRGGGIMATRDHQDLGTSLCTLGGIGRAHFFHSNHPEPDPSRHVPDDPYTTSISWPNYHSGANGDYQKIGVEVEHELVRNPASPGGLIEYFPAHPHEGAVGVPEGEEGVRVIATGKSEVTGRTFNLVVAFESTLDNHGNQLGRGIAQSSFHHFVDYNWNTDMGCPSFLEEPPGDGYKRNPQALQDIKRYVGNAARWL
ncbi:MAG TPA: hypothetical protein VGW76_02800, partial [Pyrinomonadaceae bacterium]|nr:hypothetical protein [Pyrinomonadaceae bacterium]